MPTPPDLHHVDDHILHPLALGQAALEEGRVADAREFLELALQQAPLSSAALVSLGKALSLLGEHREAVARLRGAAALRPADPEAIFSLAAALLHLGEFDEGEELLQATLRCRPTFPQAWERLAWLLLQRERWAEAAAACRTALTLTTETAPVCEGLGLALSRQERWPEAITWYRKALSLAPPAAGTWFNLGLAQTATGALDDAIASFGEALRLDPAFKEAELNLGFTCQEAGRFAEAFACYERILARHPDCAEVRFNRGWILLLHGNFPAGFADYEYRFAKNEPVPRRSFAQPSWDGSDLAGRTLLLHTEQGLADTIQFSRFALLLADWGARLVVELPPLLKPLLEGIEGVRWIARGEPLPPFDLHAPLLSLPHLLGTTLESIPAAGPSLRPDPVRVESWRRRLDADERLRVGIVWRETQNVAVNRKRSCPLAVLAPLAELPGISWYGLQLDARDEPEACGFPLIDLGPQLHDFADIAAAIVQLDLVITIDHAVAHLAGALGKPAWVLLPQPADWRWLLERSDSPWYPTLRLFRQRQPGDWPEVVVRLGSCLAEFARSVRRPS